MVGITKLKLKRVSDGESIVFGEYPFLFSQSMSFFSPAAMRETVLEYAGYDGGEPVAQHKGIRPLDVIGIIEAKQRDQYWTARTALSQFFTTSEDGTPTIYKAVFIKADGTMFAAQKCWLSPNDVSITSLYEHRDAKFSLSLRFGDPYFYEYSEDEAGDEIMSNIITLPLLTANAGGSSHDSVGAIYDSVGKVYEAGSGGVQTIVVDSIRNVYPIWTVYGSSVNPSLVSNTTGGTLSYTGTLNSGDILVVDMAAQTAKLNGAAVTANVSGDWIYLKPGQNSIGYNSSSASGLGEQSTVTWNGIIE